MFGCLPPLEWPWDTPFGLAGPVNSPPPFPGAAGPPERTFMEARQGGGGETEKGEDQGRVIRIRREVGTEGSSVLKLILLPAWHELLHLSGVTTVRGRCNIRLFSGLISGDTPS